MTPRGPLLAVAAAGLLLACAGGEERAREGDPAEEAAPGADAREGAPGTVRDSAPASREPDSVPAGRFYVRVRADAAPGDVAARHGVRPLEVITDDDRAFYAELTRGQTRALREDSLVVSLAREIEADSRPPSAPRGVAPAGAPDTAGSGPEG